MKQTLIRVKKAAKLLGYSESHICWMARSGSLKRYYVGTRSYMLDREEVLLHPHKNVA